MRSPRAGQGIFASPHSEQKLGQKGTRVLVLGLLGWIWWELSQGEECSQSPFCVVASGACWSLCSLLKLFKNTPFQLTRGGEVAQTRARAAMERVWLTGSPPSKMRKGKAGWRQVDQPPALLRAAMPSAVDSAVPLLSSCSAPFLLFPL